jgi:ATP-dependent protease ClpP protease subunit
MTDIIEDQHSYGVDMKNREIYLHGHHGSFEEDPGVDYRMASTFIKNIRSLDIANQQAIIVHMHSVGGNWGDGMAIYDAISLCRSHVTVLVYGQAESMSGIILQAADLRVMMPNSYFMSHYGSTEISGDFLNAHNEAKYDQAIADRMFEIYSEQCVEGAFFQKHYKHTTVDKVNNFLRRRMKSGDWYLTADEAVHYGFSDHVLTGSIDSLK